MAEFVDTNIFIRLIVADDPTKTRACLALFQRVRAGLVHLITSESVIAEAIYVLSSRRLYALGRSDIR